MGFSLERRLGNSRTKPTCVLEMQQSPVLGGLTGGLVLLLVGGIFLLANLGVFQSHMLHVWWPVLLIGAARCQVLFCVTFLLWTALIHHVVDVRT